MGRVMSLTTMHIFPGKCVVNVCIEAHILSKINLPGDIVLYKMLNFFMEGLVNILTR